MAGTTTTATAGSINLFDVLANAVLDAIVTPPNKGTARILDGKIEYRPASGQLSVDSLVYRIRLPDNGTTATATLSI